MLKLVEAEDGEALCGNVPLHMILLISQTTEVCVNLCLDEKKYKKRVKRSKAEEQLR